MTLREVFVNAVNESFETAKPFVMRKIVDFSAACQSVLWTADE